MDVDSAEETRKKDFQLSDLDEDVDIEVMTEVQPKNVSLQLPTETEERSNGNAQDTALSPEADSDASHERSSSWSGYLKKKLGSFKGDTTQKTSPTETKKKDWSKEQEALAKLKSSAMTTLNQVGTKFNEGSLYLYEASKRTAQVTADNLRKIRLFKTPIETVCRNESTQHPCPRLLLVCCTVIASKGLSEDEVLMHDAPEELIHAVSAHFLRENGAVLPPSGATPEVLLGVVKKFLMDLDDPLLTYKLLENWIQSGRHPQTSRDVMEQLPLANMNSLALLLDCLNRVAFHAEEGGLTAEAMAAVIAPCLLWRLVKPTPKKTPKTSGTLTKMFANKPSSVEKEMEETVSTDFSSVPDSPAYERQDSVEKQGKVPLEGEEFQLVVQALSFLISHSNAG